MTRLLIFLFIATGGACGQSAERTIPYRADAPIADRLQPGDRKVVVEMKLAEPVEAKPESYEQEIQRLRRGEIIALVRVSGSKGEIADAGTWIRTAVNADVDRIIYADKQLAPSIAFTYGGGSANIGAVEISTGKFPRFVEGAQYLVVLNTQRAAPSSLVWTGTAFRVSGEGVLQRIGLSDGSEQPLSTNLVGRHLDEVARALAH